MSVAPVRFAAALLVLCAGLVSCETTETTMKPKKRPPLPGEDVNELSWGRPTGPNDVTTPFGMPMSR
jgi:hypothetical protein